MIDRTVSCAPDKTASAAGVFILVLLGCLLGGCVPVPFRPSAAVSHSPVTAETAVPRVQVGGDGSEARSVARAVQHDEPRVVLVDPAGLSGRIGSTGMTLPELVAAAREGNNAIADYVLSVAEPTTVQLHDTGMAAPYLITVVGYEKIQSESVLPATLLDLRDPQTLQVLCASSTYSEVMTGLVYGVVTVALPEPALRESLARDVSHTLALAQPEGPIRLLVLRQLPPPKGPKPPRAFPPAIPAGCSAKASIATVTAAAH